MKTQVWLKVALLVAGCVVAGAICGAQAAAAIPNVIFVLADDQGWADVSYQNTSDAQYQPGAGGTRWKPNPPHTPNLDAMAAAESSLLFHRFYAGSAVCSPTRSAILTGRTPNRECITGAEGCGQKPAWKCGDNLPLPPTTFTVAEAAKQAGMATIHIGKWHLGNFFPKPGLTKDTFANKKWPTSHPGVHGFDVWNSTEASASSSMCNCGCKKEWVNSGEGCVIGGGKFQHKSLECTNYWAPTDVEDPQSACHSAATSTRDCVGNLTSKIPGDDTEFMLDTFEPFLAANVAAGKPFMAQLWLHTNHVPHPSMPNWYHAYTDTYGKPAGDYLGTLSQMDSQIGRLRQMLRTYGIANDTLLIFTADNGPHPGSDLEDVRSATNGLRQCKASLFEGGIRVPGIIEWPSVIRGHRETWQPTAVMDFLPTLLDITGVKHPHPEWAADGESILPLIRGEPFNRTKPLGFALGDQRAWIDPTGRYKVVYKPEAGQCKMESSGYLPHNKSGPFLFDLHVDPTESSPLNEQQPGVLESLSSAMFAWDATIAVSQQTESQCMPKAPTPGSKFQLRKGGSCLTAASATLHAVLSVAACSDGSSGSLDTWSTASDGSLTLSQSAAPSPLYAKVDGQHGSGCERGTPLWLGPVDTQTLRFDASSTTVPVGGCDKKCAAVSRSSDAVVVAACSDAGASGWEMVSTE